MTIDYNKIYKDFQPKLKTLVARQIKDKDYVEDLVQEVLLKVHRKLDTYDSQYSLSTWIYTIAFNTIKNYYKSLKDNISYSAEIYDNDHTELLIDPADVLIAAETSDKINTSLSKMGDTFIDTYVMKEVDGMSVKDISTQLNIPEGTVKSRLKRARDYIKKEIL